MKSTLLVAVVVFGTACAPSSGRLVNARPMSPAEAKVKQGDCVAARAQAAASPDAAVDSLPKLMDGPTPFTPTPFSVKADIDKNGMRFKADVVIDTMGKAKPGSLKVIESSNEWFARNLNALLPRMTFSPAMLAGCKVERVYKFMTTKPKA